MSYVYIQTEPRLWTVGERVKPGTGSGPARDFLPESDHGSPGEAAARVRHLNGGTDPAPVPQPGRVREVMDRLLAGAGRSYEQMAGDGLELAQLLRETPAPALTGAWEHPAPERDERFGLTWLALLISDGNPGVVVRLTITELCDRIRWATDHAARVEIVEDLREGLPVGLPDGSDLARMDDGELLAAGALLEELAHEAGEILAHRNRDRRHPDEIPGAMGTGQVADDDEESLVFADEGEYGERSGAGRAELEEYHEARLRETGTGADTIGTGETGETGTGATP